MRLFLGGRTRCGWNPGLWAQKASSSAEGGPSRGAPFNLREELSLEDVPDLKALRLPAPEEDPEAG